MGSPLGWVLLDKPEGISSASALNRVKRYLRVKKAGHAGTLDPAASGLLLIAIGEACKFLSVLDFTDKRYLFDLHWGAATSTDDGEGETIATSDHRPSAVEIRDALGHFLGSYDQAPPAFSALKVDGQRAYKLARAGNIERLPARPVKVFDFQLIAHDAAQGSSRLEVCFGKGGYVRSIGRDLAEHLGSCGHTQRIRRISIGKLDVERAIPLASFETFNDNTGESRLRMVLELESVLDDIPALDVTAFARQCLAQGRRCALDDQHLLNKALTITDNALIHADQEAQTYLLRHNDRVFGLGTIAANLLKPKRLLQTSSSE